MTEGDSNNQGCAIVDQGGWEFWIDRGGTFTDIVARSPNGELILKKLLSENSEQYADAAAAGICQILKVPAEQALTSEHIAAIKMGTTVATNALLERKGDRVAFVTTQGLRDVLEIGYQNRPDIFALEIQKPSMLYEQVIEAVERMGTEGSEISPLDETSLRTQLQAAYTQGIRSCGIAFLHGYRFSAHEQQAAKIAEEIGFTQISVSHEVSPLIKLVARGDTTVLDAYLSPILRRYVDNFCRELGAIKETNLLFMQSNGGLVRSDHFRGKDSILSGPAGGIIGAVKTSEQAGFSNIISFDMGGTSTDVAHYAGELEREWEMEVAGVRLRAPQLAIHTVAAGGGSVVDFADGRYQVGPASAGANPGPAAYGRGGPLTVTDCNVLLGKLQPDFFPQVFGPNADQPLDINTVQQKFQALRHQTQDPRSEHVIAEGLLEIAIAKMAAAIKRISLEKGHDVRDYALCCFGGAGGQHACLLAEALGIQKILLHPLAGVLSAYGIGLADIRVVKERSLEVSLEEATQLESAFAELQEMALTELTAQSQQAPEIQQRVQLKYAGTDAPLTINFGSIAEMRREFEVIYQQRYGFLMRDKEIWVDAIVVEAIASSSVHLNSLPNAPSTPINSAEISNVSVYFSGAWRDTPIYERSRLSAGQVIPGPAIIVEETGTNVIEPGWQATSRNSNLILEKTEQPSATPQLVSTTKPDPIRLEIFNNVFSAIAEQMGVALKNTSYSVNIKERLDFSCAIFDQCGNLVANAPHIPVHLGSMGESVASLIRTHRDHWQPGDVYAQNNPFNGGTHLPDITVITPIWLINQSKPSFFVASRGHHADIGGIAPGSMPANSQTIMQEGILLDNFLLVKQGQFQTEALLSLLQRGPNPVRNPSQNLADLQAQVAANRTGQKELLRLCETYGLPVVQAYMGFVQDNGEACVRAAIANLNSGEFICPLDCDAQIKVKITCDHDRATIDFSGTSSQQPNNFNAPKSVCQAVVLYVFRTLVAKPIPLNAGCLRPLEITIPPGSLLNPEPPAAVVAGNVETSQAIADALYGALGIMAAAQGTMNNLTFGNANYQYYETICGGSGAGKTFAGADAVQTHMTNSRLSDPEILENRYPVRLLEFKIRENSGGSGKFSGGNGVMRRIQFLEPMEVGILANRRLHKPFGLDGGETGEPGQNWIERSNRAREDLPSTASEQVQAGDVLGIITPGGGGFGAPQA